MRQNSLKSSEEDLARALDDLENVRMTPRDDPKLSELKEEIRRTIKNPQAEKGKTRRGANRKRSQAR